MKTQEVEIRQTGRPKGETVSISNEGAMQIIERLKLASFAELSGTTGQPNGKYLIRLEDAILVVADQTEGEEVSIR